MLVSKAIISNQWPVDRAVLIHTKSLTFHISVNASGLVLTGISQILDGILWNLVDIRGHQRTIPPEKFPLALPSGRIFNFYNTWIYDQIPPH